jgi:hypothetical protein
MQLIFIFGQVALGKLTVARELAARTDVALFHNHLVVDAVSAVFPFGSEPFSVIKPNLCKSAHSRLFRYQTHPLTV